MKASLGAIMIFVSLSLAMGCSGQSFTQAMQVVCDPMAYTDEDLATSPAERATQVAQIINKEVSNKEAIAMLESMASLNPADRAQALRDAVDRAGLNDCPALIDSL